MAQRRAILSRKKATQNIRKITRAMAMIASVRLQKLQKRMLAAQPYAQTIREVVAVLAANVGDLQHPLLRHSASEDATGRIALLVITSNRGLAGAYNSNVLRTASDFIHERDVEGRAVELYVIGRKGASYFTFHQRPIVQRYDAPGAMPTLADVEEFAAFFINRFTSEQIDSVHVAYTNFISAGTQRPELLTLLPMAAPTSPAAATAGQLPVSAGKTGGDVMYDFSPGPGILLGELLPLTVMTCLFECFLNAATSENAARKVAMMRATESAEQMTKMLTAQYNRARQDHITGELLDIIGASEAGRRQ